MQRKLPRFIRLIETPVEGGGGDDLKGGDDPKPKDPEPKKDDDEKLGEGGLKALQAERSARAAAEKAARDAQQALDAERNAHAATRKEADSTKVETLKYQVAAEVGIPLSLADRLKGATREEIKADAEALKPSVTPKFVSPQDPSQGKDRGGDSGGTVESGRDLYQRMRGKKSKNN